jgi:hypothetical protein
LGIREHWVRRRPHGETFVRENDFNVDAVALVVGKAIQGIGASLGTHPVFALEAHHTDTVWPVAFAITPLHAVVIGNDARRPFAVLRR